VVTGASSGIGEITARKLAARGWTCILLARRKERLQQIASEIGAEVEVCDVADREQVDAVACRVAQRHESIQLLVNNAGIPGRSEFIDADPERIELVTQINYLGGVWCLRAFLSLLERGQPSDVVNVASVAGTVAGGAGGPYSAAKHAQVAFSRSTAIELAPRGIRVHTIKPGFADTEGFPQDRFLEHPIARYAVTTDEKIADAILNAIARNRREVFVPWFYQPAAMLQGIMPATMTRVLSSTTLARALAWWKDHEGTGGGTSEGR